jgi:uncharacterized Fe-S radical SAM superfamily protein PflX
MFDRETAEDNGTSNKNNHSGCLPKDFLVPRILGSRPERQDQSPFDGPRFNKMKNISTGISLDEIKIRPLYELFDIHEELMLLYRIGEVLPPKKNGKASLLDLKIEMVRHLLIYCSLCKKLCWINRIRGERGLCRMGLNPSMIDLSLSGSEKSILEITLAGSGMRCCSCLKESPSERRRNSGVPLDHHLWTRLDFKEARFLSFNGGNPENSLLAILEFLNTAPENWGIPILWSGHSQTTPPVLSLLEGIVDIYRLDFCFACAVCGQSKSFTSQFPETAGIVRTMAREQKVPIYPEIDDQQPRSTSKESTAAVPAYS